MLKAIIFLVSRNILTHLDAIIARIKPLKTSIETPRSILIIRWDRIGDAVVTIPLIDTIKQQCPGATIDVLCSESNGWVFEGNPNIRNVIPCPGVGFTYGIKRLLLLAFSLFNGSKKAMLRSRLGKFRYDLCIDCMAGEYTPLFKPYASVVMGAKTEDGFSWLYDYYPKAPIRYAKKPVAQYFMDALCELLGESPVPVVLSDHLPVIQSNVVKEVLSGLTTGFILINISGTESYRSFKKPELLDCLATLSQTYTVLVFDDPSQSTLSQLVGQLPNSIQVLPPLSLPELASIAKAAALFIGMEGGASHYCARQCPSLIMFSSKSYQNHFQAFAPTGVQLSLLDLGVATLWIDAGKYGALVQKPKRRYPFKPYYIDHEAFTLTATTVETAVKKLIA